ncbi:putative ankyrin repeat protein [Chloropicon roscoffensis]|uniref:Ankyrin repeat protein n=1 Tax=Chloropicon roscoffensis TaxID=1461544 RepID=A0AAX4PCB9_9CHLO
MAGGADSSSSAAKRAKVEAANRDELLRKLPAELWSKILDENLHPNDLPALAMTCRFFREKQKDLGKKLETNLNAYRLLKLRESGKVASHTLGWFRWVCDTFEIQPGLRILYKRVKGAVYESDLLNYAALQASVEILRWLVEEKGWEMNRRTGNGRGRPKLAGRGVDTGEWAGRGGSMEVLEYMRGKGYEFDAGVCAWAARGGCLEALKFLRGLDPPCPWDEDACAFAAQGGHLDVLKWLRGQDPPCPWYGGTCAYAASEGHLEVLKWLRDQDPPCPWNWRTCGWAAEGGHLDVLKWARSEDPPCPWRRSGCRATASRRGYQHIIDWIDQREDESDVEYSDTDRSYDSYSDDYF